MTYVFPLDNENNNHDITYCITDVIILPLLDTGKCHVYKNHPDLTESEREVTQIYAEGWATGEIARHLNVSKKTVAAHRENMKKKLSVKGIAGITKYAIRENLTTL